MTDFSVKCEQRLGLLVEKIHGAQAPKRLKNAVLRQLLRIVADPNRRDEAIQAFSRIDGPNKGVRVLLVNIATHLAELMGLASVSGDDLGTARKSAVGEVQQLGNVYHLALDWFCATYIESLERVDRGEKVDARQGDSPGWASEEYLIESIMQIDDGLIREDFLHWSGSVRLDSSPASIDAQLSAELELALFPPDHIPWSILARIQELAMGEFTKQHLRKRDRRPQWFVHGDVERGAFKPHCLLEDAVYNLFDHLQSARVIEQLGYTRHGEEVPDGILHRAKDEGDVLYDVKSSVNGLPFPLNQETAAPIKRYVADHLNKNHSPVSTFIVVAGAFSESKKTWTELGIPRPVSRWHASALLLAAKLRRRVFRPDTGRPSRAFSGRALFYRLIQKTIVTDQIVVEELSDLERNWTS